jgi:hypothetical protein
MKVSTAHLTIAKTKALRRRADYSAHSTSASKFRWVEHGLSHSQLAEWLQASPFKAAAAEKKSGNHHRHR